MNECSIDALVVVGAIPFQQGDIRTGGTQGDALNGFAIELETKKFRSEHDHDEKVTYLNNSLGQRFGDDGEKLRIGVWIAFQVHGVGDGIGEMVQHTCTSYSFERNTLGGERYRPEAISIGNRTSTVSQLNMS